MGRAIGCLLALPWGAHASDRRRRLIRRFPIAPLVVPRVSKPTRFRLAIGAVRNEIVSTVKSPDRRLVLRLGGVRVARAPQVVWRAFLSARPLAGVALEPFHVGTVALFGTGVGKDAPSAAFTFRIDSVGRRFLRSEPDTLVLTFVPAGPLREGSDIPPTPAAELRINRVELLSEAL